MAKTITSENYERSLAIIEGERSIDIEARTVEVAFSSEQPYERWFGIEILDHAPESVQLGRLQDKGPVLMDHNRSDQVGVIEVARIDSDRRGRARLRFGKSARADEIFQDIIDGIRCHISVHYKIHKYEKTKGENGAADTYRMTLWTPTEISVVSVPADHTVGVGRSAEDIQLSKEDSIMEDKAKTPATEEASSEETNGELKQAERSAPAPVAAPATINLESVRTEERARIAEISRAASDAPSGWDVADLSREAIEKGWSPDQFRAAAFDKAKSAPAPKATAPGVEMLQRSKQDYSLVRAIAAHVSGNWDDAGFEREMAQELARNNSVIGGGLLVPMGIFAGERTDTTEGAGLIGTSHMPNAFIDTLRANTLLGRLGARFIDGLNGNLSIPKKTGNASFGFLAEGANATPSNVTVGNVSLSGKHIGGQVPMTFEMLRQSAPAIEQVVREDMLEGIALTIDAAGFSGTGATNQPRGILNTVGIQELTLGDVTNKIPTFAEIVEMEGLLDDANALKGMLAYAFRPTIHSALKVAKKDAGSGEFVISGGQANGYSAYSSTQLPANASLFGNFSDVLVGSWGVVEIVPERNTLNGGLDIGVHHMMDIAVRNAESFVKGV
ncbi:major capsid protein [Oleiphilus sp. HI0130]|nr:major capsid protein [Oleiphilus sp. HI0130]